MEITYKINPTNAPESIEVGVGLKVLGKLREERPFCFMEYRKIPSRFTGGLDSVVVSQNTASLSEFVCFTQAYGDFYRTFKGKNGVTRARLEQPLDGLYLKVFHAFMSYEFDNVEKQVEGNEIKVRYTGREMDIPIKFELDSEERALEMYIELDDVEEWAEKLRSG